MSTPSHDLEKSTSLTNSTQTPSLHHRTIDYESLTSPHLNPISPSPTHQTLPFAYLPTPPLASHSQTQTQNQNPSQNQTQNPSNETLTPISTTDTNTSHHPDYLRRLATHKSQYLGTVGNSSYCRDGEKLIPFGGGKAYPPMLPGRELYVVEFEGREDELHGLNWGRGEKIKTLLLLTYTTWIVTFTSSIFAPAIPQVSHAYHISPETTQLSISLFILGFASGPILWAPISELRGRRLPLLIAGFGFTIFSIAVATAKDIQTILLCRFWSGFCGACGIAISPAVLSDIFDAKTRGLAVTVFCTALFCGTLMAPAVGGFVVLNVRLGWRWTSYIPAILGASGFLLNLFLLKETYPPLILCGKAAELRRRTLNWGIHAKQEEVEVDFKELVQKNFGRPLRMLFTEPIVFLISLYMSLLYGIVFVFLAAYKDVFQLRHGMDAGVGGLPLYGLLVGVVLGGCFMAALNPGYVRKLERNGGVSVPEWRCPPAMLGGVCFTLGLFWFGWTSQYESVHWAVPTVSGVLTGFGILTIFLPMLNYLVDSYLIFAASAVAANTMMRSSLAAACPMFSTYLFNRLGINWGMTLVGCFAAVLIPIPIWFYISGAKLRKGSKFAPTMD